MRYSENKAHRASRRSRLFRRFRVFGKAEDGGVLIFGIMILITMLIAGGMAVDFMRFERERAHLQYTLDRSILAAAALSQPLDSKDVVIDYFSKSGLKDYEVDASPDQGLNFRKVDASANTTIRPFFLNMVGIDSLTAVTVASAEERVQKVEISLVLDVSGSMSQMANGGQQTKLKALQTAAKEFVGAVITPENKDLVSVNVIPYNMQVNVGKDVMDLLSVTDGSEDANCIDFSSTQFDEMDMKYDPTVYKRTGRFDPFYTSINHPNSTYDDNDKRMFMCPTAPYSEVMLMSQDLDALEAKIDSLVAGGNTSIDIGVKWGNFFLDPSSRAVISKLPASAGISDAFKTRPNLHSDTDAIKILIVMTDGKNTTQYTLDEDYASGDSNVWVDPGSSYLSIYDDYYSNSTESWYFVSDIYDYNSGNNDWLQSPKNATNAKRLTWPEVWEMMGTKYNAYYNQYRMRNWSSEYYEWRDQVTNKVGTTTKNARLSAACNSAKNMQTVVFTIGFEVSDASALVMEDCASSAANFYRVEGIEIADAFNAIAQTIQRLKLTK
ncbi:MAG: Tad domain-containing protein [Litoreibacter sp.]|nr:Tad domain-containing protein [Litoreibacter sp.]